MKKLDIVNTILPCSNHGSFVNHNGGYAFAPANIALCKYWGKRDTELNLPYNTSLSISLGTKGTFTKVSHVDNSHEDRYIVNDKIITSSSDFALRLKNYLDLFRPNASVSYLVETVSTVPISAGFASSASGFAALIQALNNLYDWRLAKKDLSILARLGSGSASRSLWHGFVKWNKGEETNGMDSFGEQLDINWHNLRIGSLLISSEKKKISSTEAMELSVATSSLYPNWVLYANEDLNILENAIYTKNFPLFGEISERNSEMMHQVMASALPPIVYSDETTKQYKEKIKNLRQTGLPIFFTQDAGPNLHLLFLQENESEIINNFPNIDITIPFEDVTAEQVILVNDNDIEVGIAEKLAAHKQAKLHRAFSVFILRQHNDKIEVLLQKRHKGKYHSANLWSNTACGHPKPFEKVDIAAKRRLAEEMGINIPSLKFIGKFHYLAQFPNIMMAENEIDHVFIGYFDRDNFIVNPEEVDSYEWRELSELKDDLAQNPQKYTPWFRQALDLVVNKI